VVIRHWEKGDYFYPLGLRGKKKISDFFVDKKTDLFAKKKIKLLCIDNQIVWVIGQRADDRFKIKEKTFSYYKIVYHGRI
jgi:tRNA(Ile)-lysidine synthase